MATNNPADNAVSGNAVTGNAVSGGEPAADHEETPVTQDQAEQTVVARGPRLIFQPLQYEPSTSTEEWLLTYGDMVTLLLTLFVLLVLTASFDQKKYEQEGQDAALRGIFAAVSEFRVESFYADELSPIVEDSDEILMEAPPLGTSIAVLKDADLDLIERREEMLTEIRGLLVQQKLDPYIEAKVEGDGIRLDIPNSILFEVGNVELRGQGRSVLRALVPVLTKGTYTISVEGHTDSSPIDTLEYASNWELSANRAARVVRLFVESGIDPWRLEAVGHADTRPLASNDTPDGRSENRRVTVLLRVAQSAPRPSPRP